MMMMVLMVVMKTAAKMRSPSIQAAWLMLKICFKVDIVGDLCVLESRAFSCNMVTTTNDDDDDDDSISLDRPAAI